MLDGIYYPEAIIEGLEGGTLFLIKPFIGVNSDDDDIGMPLGGLHKLNMTGVEGIKGA
jgi:hypothetical protein